MGRKRKLRGALDTFAATLGTERKAGTPSVATVPVQARAFVTIGPDHPVWKTGDFGGAHEEVHGAFVRLKPPPGTDVELIERGRVYFGAFSIAVRVDPIPKSAGPQPAESKLDLSAADARTVVWDLFSASPLVLGSNGGGGDDGDFASLVHEALEESMSKGGL